jgi:hypothetical protein
LPAGDEFGYFEAYANPYYVLHTFLPGQAGQLEAADLTGLSRVPLFERMDNKRSTRFHVPRLVESCIDTLVLSSGFTMLIDFALKSYFPMFPVAFPGARLNLTIH